MRKSRDRPSATNPPLDPSPEGPAGLAPAAPGTAATAARGPRDPTARTVWLMKAATLASVSVATALIAVKIAAWVMTGSVSLLSTLMDSVLDVLASLGNMIAVRHALVPPDREHRYGHGKAESLASLAQAAFIAGSAAFLVYEAVDRLRFPHTIERSEIGIAVMVVAIVVTVALVAFQKYVVRRTGSLAVSSDSLHYTTDVLVNGTVIVAILLASRLGWWAADPLFALAIAAYIFWGARGIALEAVQVLMDRELPDEERQRIREIALAHPGIEAVHDLRTRSSGTRLFIQLDIEVDGELRLRESHDIALQVMHEIENAYPQAEVFIHQDPAGIHEDHHRRFG